MPFCKYALNLENGGTPTDAFNCVCTKGVRQGSELPELIAGLEAGQRLSAIWAYRCYEYNLVGDEEAADNGCDWRHDLPGDTTLMPDGSLRS